MNDEPNPTPQDDRAEAVKDDGRRGKYPEHLLLWTLEDVAAMCGISRSTAYQHLKEKPWPYHHRIGTQLRFSEADIQAIQAMYRKVSSTAPEPRRTPRTGTRANRARRNGGKDHP